MMYFLIVQDRHFQNTSVLLFDGESAIASAKVAQLVSEKYGIKLLAQPRFKRMLAERMIREVKLRVSLALELEGKNNVFLLLFVQGSDPFVFSGLKLNSWKSVLDKAVNAINFNRQPWPNNLKLQKSFFTRDVSILPQNMPQYYKFKLGEIVRLDLSPSERRSFSMKWSLNLG